MRWPGPVECGVCCILLGLGGLAGCICPIEFGGTPFDPEYYSRSTHIVLLVSSAAGPARPPEYRVEKRPGPAPFQPPDAGTVEVRYLDASGNELGHHAFPDQSLPREGDIELLLPANPEIATVELGPVQGRTLRFDVRVGIRQAIGE